MCRRRSWLDIEDNALQDDIDDYIIENYVVDDDDMANPFNLDSKLDEEEYQWHWNVWGMWLYLFYDLLIEVLTYMG